MRFPLAERELARSGKRKRTYVLRMIVLGATCPMLFFAWLGAMARSMSPFVVPTSVGEEVGRLLADVSIYFQFAVLFLVAPVLCAGQVAREKQERTLQLLLLADFRGWDIFLAKFLAPFLQSELLILSTLPLMAFASFMGGVSVPAMVEQVLLMSLWTFAVCALGLFFSTCAPRPVDALFYTVLALVFWIGGGMVLDLWLGLYMGWGGTFNMAAAVLKADDPTVSRFYWLPSAVVATAIAMACCALSVRLLPRQIFERTRRVSRRRRKGQRPRRGIWRMSPGAQLVAASARGLSGTLRFTVLKVIVAAGFCALALLPCGLGWLVLLVLFFFDTTATMAAARDSGALDDVRVTPIEDAVLARAIMRAFLSKTWIYLPAASVSIFWVLHWETGWRWGVTNFLAGASIPELLGLTTLFTALFLLHAAVSCFFLLSVGCFATTLPGGPAKQTLSGVVITIPVSVALFLTSLIAGGLMIVICAWLLDWYFDISDLSALIVFSVAGAFARAIPYSLLAYALYRTFVSRCRGALSA